MTGSIFIISHAISNKEPVRLYLPACQVTPSSKDKKCFDMVCPHRTYHFQADDEQEAVIWISVLTNTVFHGKQSSDSKDGLEAQNQDRGSDSSPSAVSKMCPGSNRFEGIRQRSSTSSSTNTGEPLRQQGSTEKREKRQRIIVRIILKKLITLIDKHSGLSRGDCLQDMFETLFKMTWAELEGADIPSKSFDKLAKAIYKDLKKKFGPAYVIMTHMEEKNPDIIKPIVAALKVDHSATSGFFSSLRAIFKPFTTSTSARHNHADSPPQQKQLWTKEREDQQQERKEMPQHFGVHVCHLVSDENPVPMVLEMMLKHVEMHGLYTKGIYRMSGPVKQVKKLRQRLETDPHLVCLEDYPIHAVTDLVKQWLSELPDPLMTFAHYNDFLHAVDLPEKHEQLHAIYKVLEELPPANFSTLERLVLHLVRVSKAEAHNCMSPNSLAIVFAPCVLRCPDGPDMLLSLKDVAKTIMCVEMLINEQMRLYIEKMNEIEWLEYDEGLTVNQLKLKRHNTVHEKASSDSSVVPEKEPLDSDTEAEKNLVECIKSIKQEKEDLDCQLPEMERPGSDQENWDSQSLLDKQQCSSVYSSKPEDLDQFNLSPAVAVHKEQQVTVKTRDLDVFNLSPAVAVEDQQANYKKYVSEVDTLRQQIKAQQRMHQKNDICYTKKFKELQCIIEKNQSEHIILRQQIDKKLQQMIKKNESESIILRRQMEKELQCIMEKKESENTILRQQTDKKQQRMIQKKESESIILRRQMEKELQGIIQKNESENIILRQQMKRELQQLLRKNESDAISVGQKFKELQRDTIDFRQQMEKELQRMKRKNEFDAINSRRQMEKELKQMIQKNESDAIRFEQKFEELQRLHQKNKSDDAIDLRPMVEKMQQRIQNVNTENMILRQQLQDMGKNIEKIYQSEDACTLIREAAALWLLQNTKQRGRRKRKKIQKTKTKLKKKRGTKQAKGVVSGSSCRTEPPAPPQKKTSLRHLPKQKSGGS